MLTWSGCWPRSAGEIDQRPEAKAAPMARKAFEARIKSLMTDVPDLPNFTHFHDAFRGDAGSEDERRRYPQRLLRRL